MLVYTWGTLPSVPTLSLWHPLTTIPFLSPIYQHKERSQISPLRHVISNQRQMAMVHLPIWATSLQRVDDLGWHCRGRLKYYTSEIVVLGYPESLRSNSIHVETKVLDVFVQKITTAVDSCIPLVLRKTSSPTSISMHSLYPRHIISMSKFQCMMGRSGLSCVRLTLGVCCYMSLQPLSGAEWGGCTVEPVQQKPCPWNYQLIWRNGWIMRKFMNIAFLCGSILINNHILSPPKGLQPTFVNHSYCSRTTVHLNPVVSKDIPHFTHHLQGNEKAKTYW